MTAMTRRSMLALTGVALVGACGRRTIAVSSSGLHPGETPQLHRLIQEYAHKYHTPESLFHRIIQRESGYNPKARNGPYYGLMQIALPTAQTMGYHGSANGLLDAETNLTFAGAYLRGAWIVSGGDQDAAVHWYASGYYYEAKRLGLLEETGLI